VLPTLWKTFAIVLAISSLALIPKAQSQAGPQSGEEATPAHPVDQSIGAEDSVQVEEVEPIAAVLDNAVRNGWKSLRLQVLCPPSGRQESLEVLDNEVGLWNNSRQFEIPSGAIRLMLVALKEMDFAGMPSSFGGATAPLTESPKIPPPGGGSGTEVICRIALHLDGAEKSAFQLRNGEQSEALRKLAATLLGLAEGYAEEGVTPADLDDGLAKLAGGELAPELLALSVHRKPLAGEEGEGWLLVLRRRVLESRTYAAGGYGEARKLTLGPEEVQSLAGLLSRTGFALLPVNLWSPIYTDLDVSVMKWRKSVQARQFDGLGPKELGLDQEAFDQLMKQLVELNARAAKAGPSGPP